MERPARKQPVVEEDEPTSDGDDTEEASSRKRDQGRQWCRGSSPLLSLHLIGKAFRPGFEALAAPEWAPNRDRTVPGPPAYSAIFGSRPSDRNGEALIEP
jgi:hypothetical protein